MTDEETFKKIYEDYAKAWLAEIQDLEDEIRAEECDYEVSMFFSAMTVAYLIVELQDQYDRPVLEELKAITAMVERVVQERIEEQQEGESRGWIN